MPKPAAPPPKGPATPKRFFEVMLPHMVMRHFDEFIALFGSISFDVAGEAGGQWTFKFGCDAPVSSGLAADADLKLTFTAKAFEGFVEGTLDTVAAVRAKEVTCKGTDFTLLESFGRLMRPPASHLGWEAQTVG